MNSTMMERTTPSPKMRVNGKEMMRIQGVYMYVINRAGQVGAILGFQPLVIVAFEDVADREPLKAYLRVGRWVYSLSRSFAPIYVWDSDKIIIPDPFTPLNEPIYIVIRLPFMMSKYQKDTLWNLMDVFAHVRGKFTFPTPEEVKARDNRFELTEITLNDRSLLDEAETEESLPGTEQLESLKKPHMEFKSMALSSKNAKLSACFVNKFDSKSPSLRSTRNPSMGEMETQSKSPKHTLHPVHREFNDSDKFGPNISQIAPGGAESIKALPSERGNIMRIYIIGPRDAQHIYISTVTDGFPVSQLMLSAVETVFKEQVRLRKEKEEHGVPPTFEGRRLRLFGGWGTAEKLNEFGLCKQFESSAKGPYMDLNKIDPANKLMFHTATSTQDLEAAAGVFDYALRKCKLQLLGFSGEADPQLSVEDWLGPLIPTDIVVRYRKRSWPFMRLMTLSAAVKNDIVYTHPTNYLQRIHEDCEHHYPKLRPRNPLLDPQYPYPREPSGPSSS